MAKSDSFFGLRKGSTKSHTFQVFRGEQVTKDRVTDVANPQSDAQMEQRLKLVVVAAYAARLKGLINHSFQGVEYGEKSVGEFRRLNLQGGKLYVNGYVPKDSGICGFASVQLSKGTLVAPTVSPGSLRIANYMQGADINVANLAITDNKIDATEANAKLIASMLGIEVGQQLTLLLQIGSTDWEVQDDPYAEQSQFIISRMVTDINDENFMKGWHIAGTALSDGYIVINGNIESGVHQIALPEGSTIEPSSLPSSWPAVDNLSIAGIGAILSEKDGDTYKRSSSSLQIMQIDNEYTTFAEAKATYLKSTSKSTKYLNSGSAKVNILGGQR